MIIRLEQFNSLREPEGIMPPLFLELWMSGILSGFASAEKVFVCLVKIFIDLLQGLGG